MSLTIETAYAYTHIMSRVTKQIVDPLSVGWFVKVSIVCLDARGSYFLDAPSAMPFSTPSPNKFGHIYQTTCGLP